jgi:hypothetical protein
VLGTIPKRKVSISSGVPNHSASRASSTIAASSSGAMPLASGMYARTLSTDEKPLDENPTSAPSISGLTATTVSSRSASTWSFDGPHPASTAAMRAIAAGMNNRRFVTCSG